MCRVDDDFVALHVCPHRSLQLRVGNTTLHLTLEQASRIRQQLNRLAEKAESGERRNTGDRFGRTMN